MVAIQMRIATAPATANPSRVVYSLGLGMLPLNVGAERDRKRSSTADLMGSVGLRGALGGGVNAGSRGSGSVGVS